MSLESSVAALIAQAGLLLDLPQEIADTALQQIAAVTNNYNNILSNWSKNFYVDQVVGSDANPGTQAQPLKTIQKAVSLMPPESNLLVYLMSDYVLDADLSLFGHKLTINSLSTPRVVSFSKYSTVINSVTYRQVRQFATRGRETIAFINCVVVLPEALGGETTLTENSKSAIIAPGFTHLNGHLSIIFYNVELQVPTNRFGPITASLGSLVLFLSTTITGGRGNVKGRVFQGVTADAGTDPATLSPWASNISLV